MKEHPILFSTNMVQAILSGRKTMTRRVVKPQFDLIEHPSIPGAKMVNIKRKTYWFNSQPEHPYHITKACPYGVVGDRLWVRETWLEMRVGERDNGQYAYLANQWRDGREIHDAKICRIDYGYTWKPSIHMPRAASRITLEITGVRVERLQEMSDEDVWSEGLHLTDDDLSQVQQLNNYNNPTNRVHGRSRVEVIRYWDSLNAERGYSWDSNPWVWVIEFKRVEQ